MPKPNKKINKKKLVSVKVYFWDNGKPKEAWASGVIGLSANSKRGIPSDQRIFNSLEEFMIVLHELLKKNDVTLVMKSDSGDTVERLGKGYPLKAGPWRT